MKIHTNGGSLKYDTRGFFKYLPIMCYHNELSIANVLSLKNISDIPGCNIYMDTNIGPEIYVKYQNAILKFNQSANGLYYCRIDDLDIFYNEKDSSNTAISLLSSGPNKYTKADTVKAKTARSLQKAMMWPSSNMMKQFIKNGLITHTSISERDFDAADEIFGAAPEQVKGKSTAPSQKRDTSSQVQLNDIKFDIDKRIKLYIDIMYISGIFFLHTKSKDLDYITIHYLPDKKIPTIAKKLKYVVKRYISRGFTITDVFGDNEFNHDKYRSLFMPANLHVCATGEHVPIIERSIRTVKERARSATVELPFETIPRIMIISLLEGVERWINAFPTSNISHNSLSPATIVEGRQNPRDDVLRIPFGLYALVYTGTSNTMNSRSTPCIALRESNNNGGHYFMSLETGRRIHSNKWVEMPTTQVQIDRIHELAGDGRGVHWLDDLSNY